MLGNRAAFSGQQRLVGKTLAIDNRAVGRHGFAGCDLDHIADLKLCHCNSLGLWLRPRRQSRGEGGNGAGQHFNAARRLLSGHHFEVAPRQQKKDKHRNRVKIDFATGRQRSPETCQESRADTQCHRNIHTDAMKPQIAPSTGKEGSRRVKNYRQGQDKTCPTH